MREGVGAYDLLVGKDSGGLAALPFCVVLMLPLQHRVGISLTNDFNESSVASSICIAIM